MKKPTIREFRSKSHKLYSELPKDTPRWDRFWFRVVYSLGTLQEFILWHVIEEPCWRSQLGNVQRICDLKDRHLLNVERVLFEDIDFGVKGALTVDPYYTAICLEIKKRGLLFLPDRSLRRKA